MLTAVDVVMETEVVLAAVVVDAAVVSAAVVVEDRHTLIPAAGQNTELGLMHANLLSTCG